MKKTGIFMMVLLLFSLCGCAREQESKESTLQKKPEELLIWSYYETQAQRDGLDQLIRDFNQSQNSYHASWEYVPMTGFVKGLSSAYTENELPDMAIIDNPDMLPLIQMGMFEDLTEEAKKWELTRQEYGAIVDTLEYNGQIYGIPLISNTTALILNQDLFEEYDLAAPTDWEELRAAAKTLTNANRSGFVLCAIDSEQGAFQILPWILSAGEDPQNLGGEATKEAYAFLLTLLEDGSLPENCINLTQTDLALEFIEGRAAMIQDGPWVLPKLTESGVPFTIVPIPGKERDNAVIGGENIGILAGKNVKGSLAFLNFLMEGEALTEFCRSTGGLPPKISAAVQAAKEDANLEVFERQMSTAIPRTAIPQWSSVSGKLTEGVYQLAAHEKTPEQIAAGFR